MNYERLKSLRTAKGYHILPVKPGMQLELHEEVGEGNNKRIWRFKGLVLKVKKPKQTDGTFTIRGKTAGHTIEKIYPLSFQKFSKVILLDEYRIRRAKLYYLRDKVGKGAKLNSILGKDEKNIDLLALAVEEIEALQAAYNEANGTKEDAPLEEEVPSEDAAPAEAPAEEQSEAETQEEQSQE